MKKFFYFLLIPLSLFSANFIQTYIFFVSPDGSDSNPGTQEAPFLTIQRARDAVRALPSKAFKQQDVYVLLRGGTYRMEEPLILNWRDSGREGHDVVYSSYPGETAVLSGATQVTGWSFDAMLGLYTATIDPAESRQLYVNGRRATRAQTTPYPVAFLPSFENGGIQFIITAMNPAQWRDPSTWTNPTEIEAVIITQWKMMRVPVDTIIPFDPMLLTGLITMQEPAWTNSNIYFDIETNEPGIWSFFQVTRFENALEFLTDPGEWYLDYATGTVYYLPLASEDILTADVELPLLETLIEGRGTPNSPIHNIRFEGLTFSYATWLGPNTSDGYVADQSGFLVVGSDHVPTFIGHDPDVIPTPGNLQFSYAHNITFYGNIFEHLGAVALEFGNGSQNNTINSNLFTDISSSAIILGDVAGIAPHPTVASQLVKNNLITNNLIRSTGVEYVDTAGIFLGFSQETDINHNTIVDTPWSSIALGWGWGLLDKGSFPGLPHSYSGQWGTFTGLTPNTKNKIEKNRFHEFLGVVWDGGAIYTSGRQGPTTSRGLLIKENVATGKRPSGGGNTWYIDGGSRHVRIEKNVSLNNPIGEIFLGPPSPPGDPLPYPPYYLSNGIPYGSDTGGCVTYGELEYRENYWLEGSLPNTIVYNNFITNSLLGFPTYSYQGFFDICPAVIDGVSYPINLTFKNNHSGFSKSQVPLNLLRNAGVKQKPSTIPTSKWILPPAP